MSEATTPAYSTAERRDKLWQLIKDIRFAMFTTCHEDGHLHARPMTMQNKTLAPDGALWFFMSRQGEPLADLLREPQVNLAYADTNQDTYVSVSGQASLVDDLAKKEALWTPMAKAWFPLGPTDPDLALVRVDVQHGDYWDVKESKLVQLFSMAKAAITGKPPVQLGEHGVLHLG